MGAFDLIAKTAKGAKKAAPFFSKADVVLDELQRGKGTGQEFLTELVKKGVKPTELKDRGLDKALKDAPKMTKAEVQKVFEQKAPPKVQEKVLRDESPDYEDFLEAKAQEEYGVDWFDLSKQEKARLEKMFKELPTTQYDQYKTPGGENYREILLKLPSRGLTDHERWQLDLYNRDLKAVGQFLPEKQALYDALKAKEGNPDYVSGHYREDPNLLAHIRVQDFKTPEGKKVLLVDEVQSDWHQEGRKKGYEVRPTQEELDKIAEFERKSANNSISMSERAQWAGLINKREGVVPDAPFKKNWHELAMKRVLDYAAENGYDTVAITPGAEQAKRYDLSKSIDSIAYDPETRLLDAWDHNRRQVMRREITDESQLEDYIGKEAASKLLQAEPVRGKHLLEGQDLQVGGEGMKGFYDKILPDYLNNYGKQYGAQVGELDLITKPEVSTPQIAAPGIGHFPDPLVEPAQTIRAHSFDITPQMREQIKTKGQPLYSQIGIPGVEAAAGAGAATMGSQMFDEKSEQQVQNPVHFTENPDAMLLELMQRN